MVNEPVNNWKTRYLIIGAVTGALLGTLTAYLLERAADESGGDPPAIKTADVIKAGIGLIGVIRGIAALGEKK